MQNLQTTEYESALKRKGSLPPATTWMKLEDAMLSDIGQTQKAGHCVDPLP